MSQLETLREITAKLPQKAIIVDQEKLNRVVSERTRYMQTLLNLKALIPSDIRLPHKIIDDALEPGVVWP